ncbi:MAG: metallophosphoesterase family protein [Solirubrobacterales bacterium]|nr:metallophosphoesterase family protein [Solirubrobacterales bacterium]
MRTLVVSDLHLGARGRQDVLRRERERAALVAVLRDYERLVLLGDVLELRHGPLRAALAQAEPVLRSLGSAVDEVVVVPGNHDHGLLRGWLERRDSASLGLQSAVEWDPREALGAVVESLAPARVRVAYPGVWLRQDIYAIHGHYGDRHNTVPIIERLGAGVTVRLTGEPEGGPLRAEDYEAALAPMYAWIETVAQMGGMRGSGGDGSFQVTAWRALTGAGGPGGLRRRGLVVGFPAIVAGLNRIGIGPLRADVSAAELRRAALRAFGEVVARLGVPATHVIFGHTHRAGPLPEDDEGEWTTPAGTRLLNTGSWVYERGYLGDFPRASPYRPGFAAIVGDEGPPQLVNLLDADA